MLPTRTRFPAPPRSGALERDPGHTHGKRGRTERRNVLDDDSEMHGGAASARKESTRDSPEDDARPVKRQKRGLLLSAAQICLDVALFSAVVVASTLMATYASHTGTRISDDGNHDDMRHEPPAPYVRRPSKEPSTSQGRTVRHIHVAGPRRRSSSNRRLPHAPGPSFAPHPTSCPVDTLATAWPGPDTRETTCPPSPPRHFQPVLRAANVTESWDRLQEGEDEEMGAVSQRLAALIESGRDALSTTPAKWRPGTLVDTAPARSTTAYTDSASLRTPTRPSGRPRTSLPLILPSSSQHPPHESPAAFDVGSRLRSGRRDRRSWAGDTSESGSNELDRQHGATLDSLVSRAQKAWWE